MTISVTPFRAVPFKAWHMAAIERQPIQLDTSLEPDPVELEQSGPAWTAIAGGRPIACAGFSRSTWPHQAMAWCILAENIGAAMVPLTRLVRREFARSEFQRLEVLVLSSHAAGHRWAKLIGLEREGTMRRWGPLAVDHDIYARVK